jgi:NlpC/P60 family putative phage cell wall peptidase
MAAGSDPAPGMGAEVVARARCWIGTPYRHQASCLGAGADCLGLIRGIWRELFGAEPEAIGAYTPDWSETDRVERLAEGAARHLVRLRGEAAMPGDILLFRMKRAGVAKHLAVLEGCAPGRETIIHAYAGHGVVRSPLGPAWTRRIAARFRFPDRGL